MRETKALKNFICFMLFITMFSLCSCNKKKEEQKEYIVKEFEPISDIKEGQIDVYAIAKVEDNAYWNKLRGCLAEVANEYGVNLYYSSSQTESEWETQVTLLNMAVEAGADAIIIAPDDSIKLSEPISNVYAKGIPVALIDTTLTADDYDVCCMTDNLYAGQQAAKTMLEEFEKHGYTEKDEIFVGIQVGYASSQTISERLAGFSQYWSEYAPDSWKIIDDVKINNGDVEVSKQNARDMLAEYPELKGMFGANNGSTVGFATAIKEQERTDVVLVGFDYSPEVSELIQDSEYSAATMVQRQHAMGEECILAILDILDGKEVSRKFIDTGVIVVNKDTINLDEVKEIVGD